MNPYDQFPHESNDQYVERLKTTLVAQAQIIDLTVDAFNHGIVDRERWPFAGMLARCRDLLGAHGDETLLDACRRIAQDREPHNDGAADTAEGSDVR